jgi:oligo-1,6-glucosidase/alpha-glucosidase
MTINSGEIIYQVYPKSFQDTNGDGIGDLEGVIQRLDYIKDLGATTIWLNPIFQSPHVDNGYDVSDYYSIDPQFGSMEIVERLIKEAHNRGIKILFDLVLNHTSTKHKWFKEALKGKHNPYRDYYIWKRSSIEGQLPNNWQSFFGGSVWEKEPEGEEYYFHLFHREMPDLNWENENVRKEMTKVARFWLEKGIDGFRLDAFIHIDKEEGFPNATYAEPEDLVIAEEFFANLPKVDTYLEEFVGELRKDFPDMYILGEAASASPERALDYTFPKGKACDSIVTFRYFPMEKVEDRRIPEVLQKERLDSYQFKKVMEKWQRVVGEISEVTLYLNNHDMERAVSRFGDVADYREESAKAYSTLMYLQRGVPVILNGEEIAMRNLELRHFEGTRIEKVSDYYQTLLKNGLSIEEAKETLGAKSINSSRGAMQWDESQFAGFSIVEPWSGVNKEKNFNVKEQLEKKTGVFHHYKNLIALKKTDLFTHGTYAMCIAPKKVMAYIREWENERALVVVNMGAEKQTLTLDELKESTQVLLESGKCIRKGDQLHLSPYASIVLKFED